MFNLRAIKPEEAIENFINKQTNKVKQIPIKKFLGVQLS